MSGLEAPTISRGELSFSGVHPASRRHVSYLVWACLVLVGAAFLLTYRLTEVPPGLHVDAAVEGLNVQDVLRGHLAIFFPVNFGHGAAYVYFEAALMALAGTHRLTYGFATLAMSLIGIAFTIRLVKVMFGQTVAIMAAAFMATSLWVIFISRIGVWQSMMPAATVAPLYFLWRTLKWGGRRDALLGGIALGISQYSYYAIRFLPLLVVALCLAEWSRTRQRAWLLAQSALVSLAVFLPEGMYFALHPQVALQRPGDVSLVGSNWTATLEAVARGIGSTAGMFFLHGDRRPWQNAPFHPVFDPVMAALFCLGLLIALVRWRDVRYRWLLLWLVVMLLPTALTSDAPSNFRAYGAAPVAFVFPSLALAWLWRKLRQPRAAGLIVALLVGVEGYLTFDEYFQRWGTSTEAAVAFDAHDTALAKFAEDHAGAIIYFSDVRTLAGQPVRAMVPDTQQLGWYPEDSAAIPLPRGGTADVLYAGSPRSAIGALAPQWLPQVQTLASTAPDDPRGFWAFRWPAAAREQFLSAQQPLEVLFGQDLRLRGYATDRRPGGVGLDLLWEQVHPSGPYDLYTHVLDASGKQVAQDDKLFFPVEDLGLVEIFGQGMPTDDLVLTHYQYSLTPGHYVVEIGVAHRSPADLGLVLAAAGPPVQLGIDVP